MLEFAPIFISLVISLLVSLILLGVPFLFASNSSTYPEKMSAYARCLQHFFLRIIASVTLTPFILWTGRKIANFFLPGSGILIGILVFFLSPPKRAEAAGPSDCWTGEPDERLLRAMDKKLSRITDAQNSLAEKAVSKGACFGMGLPGSPEEQKKSITTILENHLDTLDVERRLRQIRKWEKEGELGSPDSCFWLMLVEEIRQC